MGGPRGEVSFESCVFREIGNVLEGDSNGADVRVAGIDVQVAPGIVLTFINWQFCKNSLMPGKLIARHDGVSLRTAAWFLITLLVGILIGIVLGGH